MHIHIILNYRLLATLSYSQNYWGAVVRLTHSLW
jgi:hypothetical protein